MKKKAKKRKCRVSVKLFAMMLAVALLVGGAVGGTLAWLTARTDPVVNTFTYGDINISLSETKPEGKQAKIIPGVDIEKDPKVTVKAKSEACWLFVKVVEANWPDFKETDNTTRKVKYEVMTGENGWTKLTGVEGVDNVYYREVGAVTADTDFAVLKDNKVTVSDNLTKTEVNGITANPTLTFTAYAVQRDGIDTAADAWAKVPTT